MANTRYAEKAFLTFVSFLLCVFSYLFAYGWTHVQKSVTEEKYPKFQKESKVVTILNTQSANLLLLEPAGYSVDCSNYCDIPVVIEFSSQLNSWTLSNKPPKCERLAAA